MWKKPFSPMAGTLQLQVILWGLVSWPHTYDTALNGSGLPLRGAADNEQIIGSVRSPGKRCTSRIHSGLRTPSYSNTIVESLFSWVALAVARSILLTYLAYEAECL